MFTIAEVFEQAVRFHQNGQLAQADPLYRQVINADPAHAQAIHLLGILARQTGQHEAAAALLLRAIALKPTAVAFHFNLGMVYKDQGRMAEAAACFRRELSLNPSHVDSYLNLGMTLIAKGEVVEATACYLQALRIDPNSADAHNNLGIARVLQKQFEEAIQCFKEALRLNPLNANGHINLGNAHKHLGQLDLAARCYREAIRLEPAGANAHHHLGLALVAQGQWAQGAECFREALRRNPNYANAHNSLGAVLQDMGQSEEAMACFRQAVQLDPKSANAHNNLGRVLAEQGQLDAAVESYRQALRINPQHADAHNNLGIALVGQGELTEAALCFEQALAINALHRMAPWNRGCLRLLQGDFERGWPDYEARWNQPGNATRAFEKPRWDGSAFAGKTLLVYAEQGLGDTVQFARYLPIVKARGGSVVFECQPALLGLFTPLEPPPNKGNLADIACATGTPLPPFDMHIPLLSLPLLLGTTLANLPADVPYLTAAPRLAKHWRQELKRALGESSSKGRTALKVGVVWQGSMNQKGDRRSVPLAQLAPLAAIENVRLVSLQVGPATGQLTSAGFPITDLGSGFNPDSLEDLAAALMSVDLVVTVDTVVPHLAGALGRPVWTALAFSADWRWLLERSDNPWYPTMRLFRQQKAGDWDEVFGRMAAELRLVAAQ